MYFSVPSIYISALHYLYIAQTVHFTVCILLSAFRTYILHCFSQLWVYVYFPALAPELEVAGPPMTPYSLVFEGPHRSRPRETLIYLRQYFDTAPIGGTSELSVLFIFIFDLLCVFPISDWLMYLLSADHMAALGTLGRWSPISVCRRIGHLPVQGPARRTGWQSMVSRGTLSASGMGVSFSGSSRSTPSQYADC